MDSKITESYQFAIKNQGTRKIKGFLKLSDEKTCLTLQIW